MRVLYVIKNLRISNGVSSYVMNYYRELLKDKNIHIDFLVVSDIPTPYYEEIKKNGSNIFILPSIKKHYIKMKKYLNKLFKDNSYDIVHCNEMNSGAFILKYAKKYNVPVRILHCHTSINGDTKLKKLIYKRFLKRTIKLSTTLFACSKLAGEKIFDGKEFTVIPNAVDIKKFSFNKTDRSYIRNRQNVNDKTIIIVVGRITAVKNPYFIIEIGEKLSLKNFNFEIWWFGNGDMDNEIKSFINSKKLNNVIKLFGSVSNVNEYYSASDIFILPSLWEGLPVVGIEAQISGIKCFFSNRITKEVQIDSDVEFLDIHDSSVWVNAIINYSKEIHRNDIRNIKQYGINNQALELKKIYYNLINN